jgi:hypothetical protein
MMYKVISVLFLAASLAACSSIKPKPETTETVQVPFMDGEVVVTFTKDGQFESMTSSASTRLTSNLPTSREEAAIVANLRAKQRIVEFLETEVEGERFVTTATKSLQQSQSFGGPESAELNAEIAQNVQQEIRQKSKAILRGVHTQSVVFDEKSRFVKVTVRTGAKEIATAKQVRAMMGN